MNSSREVIKICVIGAGPVGLAYIANLITLATDNKILYEIHVIEKRDLNFIRGQKIIVLNNPTGNGMRWDEFCLKLFIRIKILALMQTVIC